MIRELIIEWISVGKIRNFIKQNKNKSLELGLSYFKKKPIEVKENISLYLKYKVFMLYTLPFLKCFFFLYVTLWCEYRTLLTAACDLCIQLRANWIIYCGHEVALELVREIQGQ